MTNMTCSKCGRNLGDLEARTSFISVEVMGDEYIYSYFFCNRCDAYTVETYHDCFMGNDETYAEGPIPKAAGDKTVALIRTCPEPSNKRCACEAHRSLSNCRWNP